MGKGVDGAVSQHLVRCALQQLRIQDGGMRHEVVMAQRGFHLADPGIGDHCVLGHFTAGAGSGRDGDQRQGGAADFGVADLFHIAQRRQRMFH